jgi:hypothetical protein
VTADGGKLLHTLTKSLKRGEFDFHDFHTTHVAKALEASSHNKLVSSKADIRHSGSKDGVELTVEDPDQWQNLEEVLEAYMSNNKKTWVVTYNVKYSKKGGESSSKVLHVPTDDDSDSMEGSEHESLDEDNNKRKKLGKRVGSYSYLNSNTNILLLQKSTTTKMLKEAEQRAATAKAAGKHHHEIAHLHGCTRKNCHNVTAVCIDVGNEHLGVQPHHLNRWSQAIEDGYATLQAPPLDLITKMKYST